MISGADLTFEADIDVIGETRTGAWCETCQLPSLLVQDFEIIVRKTGERIPAIARLCDECDRGDFFYR